MDTYRLIPCWWVGPASKFSTSNNRYHLPPESRVHCIILVRPVHHHLGNKVRRLAHFQGLILVLAQPLSLWFPSTHGPPSYTYHHSHTTKIKYIHANLIDPDVPLTPESLAKNLLLTGLNITDIGRSRIRPFTDSAIHFVLHHNSLPNNMWENLGVAHIAS